MRLLMLGTGDFAVPTFQALLDSRHEVVGLVTNPDRPSGKDREMVRPIKRLALERDVPVYQPESVNAPEGVARVREFRPELLVVAAYGQIIAKDVLEAAPRGGINVHASLLPKYRGAAPIDWAIYHGETETGVTIIRMSTQLDAGDMLAQEALAIRPDETTGELEARLAPLGAKLALRVIDEIEAGTARGVKQDPAEATRAPKLRKEHGLIDWSRTAVQVCNQVRAMQPWPTAYTYWHRAGGPPVRVIVVKARPAGDAAVGSPPGTVVAVTKDGLRVAAGQGAVDLIELQPAGKRVMTAGEFLRGHLVRPGDRFAPESSDPARL
jgi:methionyl-tRNA formyltransferase